MTDQKDTSVKPLMLEEALKEVLKGGLEEGLKEELEDNESFNSVSEELSNISSKVEIMINSLVAKDLTYEEKPGDGGDNSDIDFVVNYLVREFIKFKRTMADLHPSLEYQLIGEWNEKALKLLPKDVKSAFHVRMFEMLLDQHGEIAYPADEIYPGLNVTVKKLEDGSFDTTLEIDQSRLTKPVDYEEFYKRIGEAFPNAEINKTWLCDACEKIKESDQTRYRCQTCFDTDVCETCYQHVLPERCHHDWPTYNHFTIK